MLKPRVPIRRFDVFAECNRQKAVAEGQPADEAAGYGLWVAKVVATRSYGGALHAKPKAGTDAARATDEGPPDDPPAAPKWHTLKGQAQTDALFQEQVVARMGQEFYDTVFVPAIAEMRAQDRPYQSFRDTVRRTWVP